ncbi:MAG: sigma-70 family RNA polymerase sigma factor [Acidobacteriota bacterium]
MKDRLQFMLVDETGRPLSPHIAETLVSLVPKFRRKFPLIRDHALLTDFLEEAGRRLIKRERSGPIEHLHGYAWVTLHSVAVSWLRLGSSRLALNTLTSEESTTTLNTVAAIRGGPEQIEQSILGRQVLGLLSREERRVCIRRALGYSSREIAKLVGTSPGAVDTLVSRAKARLRRLLGVHSLDARRDGEADRPAQERPDSPSRGGSDDGKLDDE